jgi:hypothetical protein
LKDDPTGTYTESEEGRAANETLIKISMGGNWFAAIEFQHSFEPLHFRSAAGGGDYMRTVIEVLPMDISRFLKVTYLKVQGGSVDVKKVLANLHKLQRLLGTGSNADGGGKLGTSPLEQQLYPVCFCPPEEYTSGTPIQLPCTHSYCKDCFHEWITGTRT